MGLKAFFSFSLNAARNGVGVNTNDTLLIAHLICPPILFCVLSKISVRPADCGTGFSYLQ